MDTLCVLYLVGKVDGDQTWSGDLLHRQKQLFIAIAMNGCFCLTLLCSMVPARDAKSRSLLALGLSFPALITNYKVCSNYSL